MKQKRIIQQSIGLSSKIMLELCDKNSVANTVSDEEIIEMAKKNNDYFLILIMRYESKIKTYVRRITGAPNETVEDIAQEVFIKVYMNADKFDQTRKFSSWIYRIAHNQAINKYLYEKRRHSEAIQYGEKGEMITVIKDGNDIWNKIQQDNVNEKLQNALAQVPEKYRAVIKMNYFGDCSYREMAEKLGRPVNTIGTMLNRGRKILKKELVEMGIFCDVALIQMEKI